MAEVHIVDIDGEQWDIKDLPLTERVAALENNQTPEVLSDVAITLNSGYSAVTARLNNHYKIGKTHFALVVLQNVNGANIGTTGTAVIGTIPLKAFKTTAFLLFDYTGAKIARCYIDENGQFCIGESNGVTPGSNSLLGEIIFVEK